MANEIKIERKKSKERKKKVKKQRWKERNKIIFPKKGEKKIKLTEEIKIAECKMKN